MLKLILYASSAVFITGGAARAFPALEADDQVRGFTFFHKTPGRTLARPPIQPRPIDRNLPGPETRIDDGKVETPAEKQKREEQEAQERLEQVKRYCAHLTAEERNRDKSCLEALGLED